MGATQLHGTLTEFSPSAPEKVKVALAGQAVSGIETVTCVVWPGESCPPGGLKVITFIPLPDVFQFTVFVLFWLLSTVARQLQPRPAL